MLRAFQIDPSSGVPPYMQIKEQIRTQIAMGYLEPHEALPVIRQLAQDLVINPNTVARAYRELELEGLLRSRVGHGTFVTEQGMTLTEQVREVRVREHLVQAMVDAHNLQIPESRLRELFEEALTEMVGAREKVQS